MQIYPIIGLIILVSSFLTQLIKLYRTRRVDGISPGAIWQLIACCLLFSGYYLGNGHFIALALNVLLLATAIGILALYYRYRSQFHRLPYPSVSFRVAGESINKGSMVFINTADGRIYSYERD